MRREVIFRNSIITSYIFIFIVLYFLFLANLFIFPNNFKISIVLLIGFAIIIIGVFYFFINIELTDGKNKIVTNFKMIDENSIKIILIILMFITFFIPPVSFTETIIDWNQIGFFNYLRAIIFLAGCTFIPGACIFKILFPNNKLHEKFNVEPFLLKITIYPILSLAFLGSITFFLDQSGLLREYFVFVLFIIIIILFAIDQLRNKNYLKLKSTEIKLSKYTCLILFMAIGIIIIALGIHLSSKYLIPGDSWRGITSASLIGKLDISPVDDTSNYAIYWGYISFSLSVLSGLPYININVMLFPFLYLFITSTYLFMKAILHNLREVYIVLSTILVVTFSELFYIFNVDLIQAKYSISSLLFDGILNFRYKSFATFLLLISMALFIITVKTSRNLDKKLTLRTDEFSIIALASFFLLQSYMIYFLPAIAGISLIFLYCLLSNKKKQDFKFFLNFWLILITLFIFFDLYSVFFFSWIPSTLFSNFLGAPVYVKADLYIIRRFLTSILIYSILIGSFILFFLIDRFLISNLSKNRKKEIVIIKIIPIIRYILFLISLPVIVVKEILFNISSKKLQKVKKKKEYINIRFNIKPKITSEAIFILILFVFSVLLEIQIFFNILIDVGENFFLFYLNVFFINIGFIGLLGIYLSYFTFKKNKQLFYLLLLWGIVIYGLASLFIFKGWFQYPNTPPSEIPEEEFFYMTYWYDRIWHYLIIPISIFSSIGIIRLKTYLKSKRSTKLRNGQLKFNPNLILTSIIIFLSFSNTIIAGMYWDNRDNQFDYYIKDEDAQIIGWVSENIPSGSNILIDRNQLKPRLDDIAKSTTYYIWYEITEALDNYQGWETSYTCDSKCNIEILEELSDHKNILTIDDQNAKGSASINIKFNSSQKNGFIEFFIKTTDKSQNFWIDIFSPEGNYGIALSIIYDAFHFYNGSGYQKIYDIENDTWYQVRIAFECSDANYLNLDKYHWKLIINGTEHGDYVFWNIIPEIGLISLSSQSSSFNYSVLFDGLNFSWARDLDNFEEEIINIYTQIIIDHLNLKNIQYYIISKDSEDFYKNKELLRFFKEKLYEYKNLAIYYANETN